jgi:hypothetical protein
MKPIFFDSVVIQTSGELDDLEVVGANVEDAQLQLILEQTPVLRVRNQDGIELNLFFDMDQETLIAATVER